MSIFSSIMSKIFPSNHPAVAASASARPAATASAPAASRPPAIDLETMLNGLAKKHPEPLNWRTSIVDLMKLLGLDSSLGARKALAQELRYPGDMNDSAAMNIWLHRQVMKKVAENGGKVPAELQS